MNTMIDALITLDTDYYLSVNKDLQMATNNMSEIDKKLWILTHFVKNGYSEKRKYRIKQTTQIPAPIDIEGKSQIIKNAHKHALSDDISAPNFAHRHSPLDTVLVLKRKHKRNDNDVQKLIQKFRDMYSKNDGGVRDKKVDAKVDVKVDVKSEDSTKLRQRKIKSGDNFFCEVKH